MQCLSAGWARRVVVGLFVGGLVLALVAILLFASKRGPALYPPAQGWLVAAGALMLPLAVHIACFGVSERSDGGPTLPRWMAATGTVIFALAALGGGLSYHHDERWIVFLLPAAFAAPVLAVWAVSRDRDPRLATNPLGACAGSLVITLLVIWAAVKVLT